MSKIYDILHKKHENLKQQQLKHHHHHHQQQQQQQQVYHPNKEDKQRNTTRYESYKRVKNVTKITFRKERQIPDGKILFFFPYDEQ